MNILEYSKKPKKQPRDYAYITNIMGLFGMKMFDYDPPDGLSKMQVERALSESGIACLYKCYVKGSVNYGRWCCTPAYPATVKDNNGDFERCTTHGTDYAVELDVGTDCILLYNNNLKTPDSICDKYAELIGETDKTIMTIVKWSRLTPIPKVYNDNDVARYKTTMQSILDGNLINVISDKTGLLKADTSTSKDEDLLQLTDVTASEKLHFLSEFRENVIKRLCNLYGIPMSQSSKNSQVISDELHGMDIYSMYVLFDRYEARKESFERASIYTGHDWKFRYSDITQHTIDDVFNHMKGDEQNAENSETQSGDRETLDS